MKDDLAFADSFFTIFAAVLCLVAVSLADRDARAPANPPAQEIRYIEPVTAIGRPEVLADESLASAKPGETGAPLPGKRAR